MAELYRRFAKGYNLDFSDTALEEMYLWESKGEGTLGTGVIESTKNGFFHGKRLLDITVKMWLEDFPRGLLFLHELYDDFPEWFINSIFGRSKRVRVGSFE